MLQEMAARTDAGVWAAASMLFFLAAYAVAAVCVWRAAPAATAAWARLPLDGDGEPAAEGDSSATSPGPAGPYTV